MEMNIDKKELVELCEEFINVPSPVSYYEEVGALLEKKAAEFGYEVTYDRKRTAYITLEGEDNSKTVCMGAHLDTIGLVVRHIDDNGHLIVRQVVLTTTVWKVKVLLLLQEMDANIEVWLFVNHTQFMYLKMQEQCQEMKTIWKLSYMKMFILKKMLWL